MDIVNYQPKDIFEELLGDFFGGLPQRAQNQSKAWKPAVNIKEASDKYIISADVPGVKPEDVEVTFENGVLTIKGERTSQTSSEEGDVRREERAYGSFVRQFSIPDGVDEEGIAAKSTNGVLEVVLPRAAKIEPRKIAVQ